MRSQPWLWGIHPSLEQRSIYPRHWCRLALTLFPPYLTPQFIVIFVRDVAEADHDRRGPTRFSSTCRANAVRFKQPLNCRRPFFFVAVALSVDHIFPLSQHGSDLDPDHHAALREPSTKTVADYHGRYREPPLLLFHPLRGNSTHQTWNGMDRFA